MWTGQSGLVLYTGFHWERTVRIKIFLSLTVILILSFIYVHYLTNNPIYCDYDIAGPISFFQDQHTMEEFGVSHAHMLLVPILYGLNRLFIHNESGRVLIIWIGLIQASITLTVAVVWFIIYLLTKSLKYSTIGSILYLSSNAVICLARLLEDNVPTTFLLSVSVLLLILQLYSIHKIRYAFIIGISIGISVLTGFYTLPWIPFVVICQLLNPGNWRRKMNCTIVFTLTCLLFIYFTTYSAELLINHAPALYNPIDYFIGRMPNKSMFAHEYSSIVHLRYFMLGAYYSLFSFPAELDREWNARISQITNGSMPGVTFHIFVSLAIIAVCIATVWLCRKEKKLLTASIFLIGGILFLDIPNIFVIDGSFMERFDQIPLLFVPLTAICLSRIKTNRMRIPLGAGVSVFIVLLLSTNLIYVCEARGRTRWQYADTRALHELAQPNDKFFFYDHVGEDSDYDYLCQATSQWLGRRNTFIIAWPNIKRNSFYATLPINVFKSDVEMKKWYNKNVLSLNQFIINDDAVKYFEPLLINRDYALKKIMSGRNNYYRATKLPQINHAEATKKDINYLIYDLHGVTGVDGVIITVTDEIDRDSFCGAISRSLGARPGVIINQHIPRVIKSLANRPNIDFLDGTESLSSRMQWYLSHLAAKDSLIMDEESINYFKPCFIEYDWDYQEIYQGGSKYYRLSRMKNAGIYNGSFERGSLDGWRVHDIGFLNQPVKGLSGNGRMLHHGDYYIDNAQNRHNDSESVNENNYIESTPFVISHRYLCFYVEGGQSPDIYVELSVDGKTACKTGAFDLPYMKSVRWDLANYKGKTGIIRIVDNMKSKWWNQISADAFKLSDYPLIQYE